MEQDNDLDRPINNLGDIAVLICETISCDNCPVVRFKCDSRTDNKKELDHEPCCSQLKNWIIRQSKKEKE